MRRYKAVQGPCTFMYLLVHGDISLQVGIYQHSTCWYIPTYAGLNQHVPAHATRTFRYFVVLPCTVLYPLADFNEILVSECTVYAGIYQDIPVYAGIYQHVPAHTTQEMLAHPDSTDRYVLCCTGMY